MSGNGTDWADQQAKQDYTNNQDAQMREAEAFKHSEEQRAYNARIAWERQQAEERARQEEQRQAEERARQQRQGG